MKPICHVVAGANGAGKSTFALKYLPEYAGAIEYVNPDLMAQGLSPTDISLSALKAGKLALTRIADLVQQGVSFGFETTLSGRGHLKLLKDARATGFEIHLYYLWIPSSALLPSRIRHRVLEGGHNVPSDDVMRRYGRSVANVRDYTEVANLVRVFDATSMKQRLIYSRSGKVSIFDGDMCAVMRKDLGI